MESQLEYLIPSDFGKKTNQIAPTPHDMNGPASSIAFYSRFLSCLMLPFALFGEHHFYFKMNCRAALHYAKSSKSLAWALRGWSQLNNVPFEFAPNGLQIWATNLADETGFPIFGEQQLGAFYQKNGWRLLSTAAFTFPWDTRDILLQMTPSSPEIGYCIRKKQNSNDGVVDIICIPQIDYKADIVDQVNDYIDLLDKEALQVCKYYNTHK